jgi:hypothetical protein
MKTLKHNILQKNNKLQKKRLTNKKYIHNKSKLINRKHKLIHKKSKLVHRNKKGGNHTNPSIIYLTKAINHHEFLISKASSFSDVYKKKVLQLFKLNIDNVYKCAKVLNFLYEDLDKNYVHKNEYAKYRIEFFFKFMKQLQNNIMMSYIETNNFYNRTEYYLESNVLNHEINNEYKIYNKKLIKKFINYFHNILSYQTIKYDSSNKSEFKIYIEHNSELTNIINQLIQNKIDGNIKYNQENYLDTIFNLFNILRTPMEKKSITWDNNNDNNTIIEEILKLYDKIMIFAELIQFDLNERKNRKKEIKSFFISKTYYNNHFIDSKKKFIHENVKYILNYYNVITQIFKDQKIINLILNYPKIIDLILNDPKMIDLIFNDTIIIDLIFNDPIIIDLIDDINHKDHNAIIDLIRKKNYEEIIALMMTFNKHNNNTKLSNYLGHPNNNNSQLFFPTPIQQKELTNKNLKIISRLKQFTNKSNKSNTKNRLNTENSSRVANIQGKLKLMFSSPATQDLDI